MILRNRLIKCPRAAPRAARSLKEKSRSAAPSRHAPAAAVSIFQVSISLAMDQQLDVIASSLFPRDDVCICG